MRFSSIESREPGSGCDSSYPTLPVGDHRGVGGHGWRLSGRGAGVQRRSEAHTCRLAQPPNSLASWAWKVSTDSVPNSRIAQISAPSRTPRTRIGAGRLLRLIKINSPE